MEENKPNMWGMTFYGICALAIIGFVVMLSMAAKSFPCIFSWCV